jgi:hypothetical protein
MQTLRSTSVRAGRPRIDEALARDGDLDAAGIWESP